jgi:4-amino-4-deoxy-L-arabinose transferase-like glycosyltransferase
MSSSKSRSNGSLFLSLIILAFAVFLTTLNRRPVPTIDGAVYASVAREIIESGQWFPLTYQGKLFAEHPPLYVWSIATSFKIFGVNDFAANLPTHLFGALIVILTGLIALRAGMNRGVALGAALTLCLTRDFVLSSVRGYIEPLLIFWIYLALYFVIVQFYKRSVFWSFLAAVSVLGAWLAKGPPALWPTVFFLALLLWKKASARTKIARATVYVLTIVLGAGAVVWLALQDTSGSVTHYVHKQVLSSALTGRGGAQSYDPFFFANILWTYYRPWIFLVPFLFLAMISELSGRNKRPEQIPGLDLPAEALFPRPLPSSLFLIFALGFIGGFSVVKWKFWYYIAPAYPALALAFAAALYQKAAGLFERPFIFKLVNTLGGLWIGACACFPVMSWKERVPEVTAYKEIISSKKDVGRLYYFNPARDHNLVATSGFWSFGLPVVQLQSVNDIGKQPKGSYWFILSADEYEKSKETPLLKGSLLMAQNSSSKSVLLLVP